MRTLNFAHRGVDEPTDVLAFPIDADEPRPRARASSATSSSAPSTRTDVIEAAVHGTLHLCGYDHETDDGEMLALQERIMAGSAASGAAERAARPARASSASPGGRTPASRRSSTRSSAPTSRSSPTARRRPAARSAASRPTPTRAGSSSSSTCPGVQRPRDVLTERMQRRVERELADSDVVLFVVNGEEGVGPGDRFISKALLDAPTPTPRCICAVNKIDRLNNAETGRGARRAAAELDGRRRGLPGQRPDRARASSRWSSGSPSWSPRAPSCTRPSSAPTSRARCCSPS